VGKTHGAPKAIGGPSASWPFFFFRSAWFVEIFCLGGGNFVFAAIFFFGGPFLIKDFKTLILGIKSVNFVMYVFQFNKLKIQIVKKKKKK
jgi:hypothetical protein